MDWQTITALTCVFGTLAVFAYFLTRPKSKSGCGKSCGCGNEKKSVAPVPPTGERG
jgi:hypothetical protein